MKTHFINFSIIIFSILLLIGCLEDKTFKSDEWKQWAESENNPSLRWEMHRDLLNKYDLKTYSKEEIVNLLGKPDIKKGDKYHYLMGYTGKGINTGTLIVIFKNDSVQDIKIVEG